MEAQVLSIVNDLKLAINKDSNNEIKEGDIFIILGKSDELFDPETEESLGILEIPKLKMKVINIQDKIILLESAEITITETDGKTKKTITKKSSPMRHMLSLYSDEEIETITEEERPKKETVTIRERDIKEGDIARKI